MAEEPFTAVGRIVKTHGLKGEVSVVVYSDASLDLLVGMDAWLVPPSPAVRQTAVVSVRPGPKGPIASLAGVEGIDLARGLTGRDVLVRTEALPPEWFDAEDEEPEVTGYVVIDRVRGGIGTVDEVLVTGANDVWVVHGPFGEVLIPVIDDVVDVIDDEARTISIRLLDGLIEEGE